MVLTGRARLISWRKRNQPLALLLQAAVLLAWVSCAHTPAPYSGEGDSSLSRLAELRWAQEQEAQPRIVPVFLKGAECPNWDEAIEIARQRACCGVDPQRPNRGNRDCPCQQAAPCDICLFLNSDRPPKMTIEAGANHGRVKPTGESAFEGSPARWSTQEGYFSAALCFGAGKAWRLAATMIHESSHLCQSINYELAEDALGRTTHESEDCHAYGLAYKCGFNVLPPRGSGCFVITR